MRKIVLRLLVAVALAGSGLAVTTAPASAAGVCGGKFAYRAHVQDLDWQPWVCGGQWAGTQGLAKNLEAIEFQINPANQETFCARAHRSNYGWDSVSQCASSGTFQIGTTGMNSPIEAVEVRAQFNAVEGNAYSRNVGWLDGMTYSGRTGTIGTTGQNRPMEMFWINIKYVS
ncbi:hypothetical protein [Kitasatospora sp. NPDC057015]|uniref:hypothetical protein n=1 Tax=Kitasatospora sp. NPDC057015 TaxID=3346001 RepID=UPI003642C5DA